MMRYGIWKKAWVNVSCVNMCCRYGPSQVKDTTASDPWKECKAFDGIYPRKWWSLPVWYVCECWQNMQKISDIVFSAHICGIKAAPLTEISYTYHLSIVYWSRYIQWNPLYILCLYIYNETHCLSMCNNCLSVDLYMMNMLDFLDAMDSPSEPSQLDISYFSLCVCLFFIHSLISPGQIFP